jgi:SET domain-containing protein
MKTSSRRPFRVGRSATGLGLFATAPIKKGDFMLKYWGRKITNKVADQLETKYLFELNKRYTIDGANRRNIARYANHSCRPNAETDIVKGEILVTARRNIEPGEEITYNYGKAYFDMFIKPHGCKCPKCTDTNGAAPKRRNAKKATNGAEKG